MALSENLLLILEFPRKKAKDLEFIAKTARRRAPGPGMSSASAILTTSEIELLRQLKKTVADLPASAFKAK